MSNGNCYKYRNGDPGRRHCSTANQIGSKINYLYVAFSVYLPNTCLSEIITFPHLLSTSPTLFLSISYSFLDYSSTHLLLLFPCTRLVQS